MILWLLAACLDEAGPLTDPSLVAGTWVSGRTRIELDEDGHGTMTWVPACAPWCSHGRLEEPLTFAHDRLVRASGESYEAWHTSRMLWLGPHENVAAWPQGEDDAQALEARMVELQDQRRAAAAPMAAWWLWLSGDVEGARAAVATAVGDAGARGLAEARGMGVDLTKLGEELPSARGVLGEAQQSLVPGATVLEKPGLRLVLVPDGPAWHIAGTPSPWPPTPDLAPGDPKATGERVPLRYGGWSREGDTVTLTGGPTVDVAGLEPVETPDPSTVLDVWTARWLDAVGP